MNYIPCKLSPCYQEYLWGGRRLREEFGRTDAPEITAESWELAQHEAGVSRIAEGEYAGETLAQLGERDRVGFWGRKCGLDGHFPLMVKLIDASKALSVQVHPSDRTALAERHERGKAELWYIVDCKPGAFLYFGFSREISREEFLRRARDGSICQVLNRVPVRRGDVFFIQPGTIHAIGKGILLAEIQQNSNTTFRVYDYQRRDARGELRPLHLERAAEVVSLKPIVPRECRANSAVSTADFSLREMFCCRYFKTYCIDVAARIELRCDGDSFQHLLCVGGDGFIRHNGQVYPFRKGDSYFMPAALGSYTISGSCRVLLSRV